MGEQVGALQGLGCEAEDVVDGYEGAGGGGWANCIYERERMRLADLDLEEGGEAGLDRQTDIEISELGVGAFGLVVMGGNSGDGATCFVNFCHCVTLVLSFGITWESVSGFYLESRQVVHWYLKVREVRILAAGRLERMGVGDKIGGTEARQGSYISVNAQALLCLRD